jgi:pimeloyl-ACP methyl ester carboxylesterase
MKRVLAAALAVAASVALAACTSVPTPGTATAALSLGGDVPDKPVSGGVVYLIRGGLNVFSTGMDEVAAKLRAKGFDATSEPFANWRDVNDALRKRYAAEHLPIVLVGHSFGADTEIIMANDLQNSNIPIELMILLDVTDPVKVPANVKHVIYIASSTVKGLPISVTGERGFTGDIEKVDVPEGHLDMDNAAYIQDATIKAIMRVIRPSAVAASQ